MNRRKRALVAALMALAIFSTAFAAAASLGVTSETLGAGTAAVASCDTNGVTTSYDTAYSASQPGYKVTTVHVTGIATPGCDAKSIRVTLMGAANASLAEQTATLATPAADPALNFSSSNVDAALVVSVAVVISN